RDAQASRRRRRSPRAGLDRGESLVGVREAAPEPHGLERLRRRLVMPFGRHEIARLELHLPEVEMDDPDPLRAAFRESKRQDRRELLARLVETPLVEIGARQVRLRPTGEAELPDLPA